MTKQEAKQALCMLSSGTLANLTGIKNYDEQDKLLNNLLEKIDLVDVTNCKTWQDVWNLLK